MAIQIQERDINIMKFVFGCRAVTHDQIHRRYFPKAHKTAAWRRIRYLANAGLLEIAVIELGKRVIRVIKPSKDVWPYICDSFPFKIENPLFKSESLKHDVRLADIFMKLEKVPKYINFLSENLLQSSLTLAEDPNFQDAVVNQSDGALVVANSQEKILTFAIELELSKKSPERYREKFTNYYGAHSLDGVLYITSEKETARLVARIDDEIRESRSPKVFQASESDILLATQSLTFSSANGAKIEFLLR